MLNILSELPKNFLTTSAREIHKILKGPTLIHLSGKRKPPLFISVLMHGNEDTGLIALQKLLIKYTGKELPRALSIFVGNVKAARYNQRHLDSQPDYNRIWKDGTAPENNMAMQVIQSMRKLGVFISVDVHNNTGLNPHYACVNRVDYRFLKLATVFSRRVVYFIKPEGTQSMAFAEICPSLTLECGQPGHEYGTEHVLDYLEGCLHLAEVTKGLIHEHDMILFHALATIKVPRNTEFGFGSEDADICFVENLDTMNFQEIPKGTVLGKVRKSSAARLSIRDEYGADVSEKFIEIKDNVIYAARKITPSMLTLDKDAIRKDCLGYILTPMKLYLMEKKRLHKA